MYLMTGWVERVWGSKTLPVLTFMYWMVKAAAPVKWAQNVLVCCPVLVIYYSLSGCIISWRNMEPHFSEWIGLLVISMPWKLPPCNWYQKGQPLYHRWVLWLEMISQYPSQVLSLPLMADNNLTLPAAKSTLVPKADRVIARNEEWSATGGTPLSITSCSLSMNSGLASIDLSQEMLDKESRGKLKGKIKWLGSKLKREREFHSAILGNYEEETVQDMEETRYRMHLYWYKQKIQ